MRGVPQGADAHLYIYTQQLFHAHFFTLIIVTPLAQTKQGSLAFAPRKACAKQATALDTIIFPPSWT